MVLSSETVANFQDISESGVGPASNVVREVPILTGEWSINKSDCSRHRVLADVGVNEGREMSAEAEEVRRRDRGVACNFALDDHVALMNHRVLETISEEIDSRSS